MRVSSFSPLLPMRGFTLLEVLVAVVIMAIGILGLVGLQTSSLRQNQSALARTLAIDYANAMMDKMRSNPQEAMQGYYNVRSNPGDTVNNVPENSQAVKDVRLWRDNLKKALPEARVQVCRFQGESGSAVCGTEGDYFMVCIKWDQTGGRAEAGTDPLFEANTQQFYLVGRI